MKKNSFVGVMAACLAVASTCLVGCSATAPTGTTVHSGPTTFIYTQSSDYSSILEYPVNSGTANYTVENLILPSNLSSTVAPRTDSQGNIYVPVTNGVGPAAQILVYAPGSSGQAKPLRSIEVTSNMFTFVVDPQGQQLYVVTQAVGNIPYAITVYSALGNGPATPLRTLELTEEPYPAGNIAVDASGNLYIVEGVSINVYAPGASGSDQPTRAIVLSPTESLTGIAVDSAGNILASVESGSCCHNQTVAIQEFAPDANGAATPLNTITVVQSSGIQPPEGGEVEIESGPVVVDSAGNIFTGVNLAFEPPGSSTVIYGFAPNASDNAAPITQTTLSPPGCPNGFAVN
jgi:hypothetical protein